MALCATPFKAIRYFQFFRRSCCVERKELGTGFYQGSERSLWSSAGSPCFNLRRWGIFWFEQSFRLSRNYTVIHHEITHSMLDGLRWVIHQEPLMLGAKRRIGLGGSVNGPSKTWSWFCSGALRASSSHHVVGSFLFNMLEPSNSSLATSRRQYSAANDGQMDTFGWLVRCEDLVVSPKPVPRDFILEETRTVESTFQARDEQKFRGPSLELDAVSVATPQQKSRTKGYSGGAKVGIRLTPSYVIELLQRQKDPRLAFMFFKWAGLQTGYKHTSGTYCTLIKALGRSKMFGALQQVKNEIGAKGLGSSTFLLGELATAFSHGGFLEETIVCLQQMEHLGSRPSLRLYNTLVYMLAKAGFPDRAHLLHRRMIDAGCRPDSCTFNNLLAGYGNSSDLVKMHRVLEEMKHHSCKPTKVTIAILLNVLCKADKVDEAWKLFEANKDLANVVVRNIMLHGLCKVGRTEEALELFEQMKEKELRLETATFNILIHGLGLAERTKDAIQLFQTMVDCRVAPDVRTYNVTLKSLIKDNQLQEAWRFFQDMTTKGLTPDVLTYGTLIRGFCKKGNVDIACQLFISMQACFLESDAAYTSVDFEAKEAEDGVLSSIGRRSTFLRAYKVVCTYLCTHLFTAGRVDEAHELFRGTADYNLYLYAYNTAIQRLGNAGDIGKAWKLFQSMPVHGCKPDVVTYNTLISSLGKSKQFDRACELFLKMQVLGFVPDVVTCTSIVDALCKSGRAQRALDLFEEMQVQGISPNVCTYHSLFDGLCKEGQLSRAYMLYEEMVEKQCLPNEVMYRTLIREFSSAGDLVNHAYRLYIEMSEKGYSPDPRTSRRLIRSLRKAGKTAEALHVSISSSEGKLQVIE